MEKSKAVETKLHGMKLPKAADKVRDSIQETLTYMNFPEEHWMRIRTNNTLEQINLEIKRCTKVVGTFPDGESALMLVCARLRHVASSSWCTKRFLNMDHLTSILLYEEEPNKVRYLLFSRNYWISPPAGRYLITQPPSRSRQVCKTIDGT